MIILSGDVHIQEIKQYVYKTNLIKDWPGSFRNLQPTLTEVGCSGQKDIKLAYK